MHSLYIFVIIDYRSLRGSSHLPYNLHHTRTLVREDRYTIHTSSSGFRVQFDTSHHTCVHGADVENVRGTSARTIDVCSESSYIRSSHTSFIFTPHSEMYLIYRNRKERKSVDTTHIHTHSLSWLAFHPSPLFLHSHSHSSHISHTKSS